MQERIKTTLFILTALLLAGCDPTENPDLFALGVGGGTVVFTIIIILFSLVVTVISFAIPIVIIVMVMKAMQKSRAERERVLSTGAKAQGTVIRLSETGTYINNQPLVNIHLHVQSEGRPPFEATVQQVLSQLEIPRVQPGMKVVCAIDPQNPSKVAINLNAPVIVDEWCNYCHKYFPAGAQNCPHCGAPAHS